MPTLSVSDKGDIAADIMEALSSTRTTISVSKPQLVAGITVFDDEANDCETAIIAALPTDPATWLTAHPEIARRILGAVVDKRRAVL